MNLAKQYRNTLRTFIRAALVCAILVTSLAGCDSFLDPSVTVRMESTPIILPILDRISAIEEAPDDIPGLSQVQPEDLIPEISEYVLGPGDLVTVTVFELITPGVESVQTRRVDELGYIRLPIVGQVKAGGLTTKKLEQRIIDILDPDILRNPTVTVIVQEARQRTFNLVGPVGAPGPYTLMKNNFRLVDALAMGHGFPPDTKKIYVIRQVPLSDLVENGRIVDQDQPGDYQPPMTATHGQNNSDSGEFDPAKMIEQQLRQDTGSGSETPAAPDSSTPATPDKDVNVSGALGEALEDTATTGQTRWVNVDGKWVEVSADSDKTPSTQGDTPAPATSSDRLPSLDQLVTQRVIEIDAQALMRGEAKYNIVIRPDDTIRVPAAVGGYYFMGGPGIARPGAYSLTGSQKLTVTQAVLASGGLSPIGIPERVDLTRRLDDNTQAILRFNYRAIAEGLQPDFYIKVDDSITFGTNAVAPFLAVARNSFRMTYGFGFLLDRNFGTDVFGPIDTTN